MKKILILFGGNSYEHEISCLSAKTIIENIDTNLFIPTIVGIHNNNWYLLKDDYSLLEKNNWLTGNIKKIDNIIEFIKQYDKVFPIIHGNDGETGDIFGLLNLFNIPYVGSNILGHSMSYEKYITKIIASHYHIPQIPYIVIDNNQKIKKCPINFPVIIKPSSCGSSIGINIANNLKELNKYLNIAFKYSNKVIIEKYLKVRELECAILEDKKLIISDIGEIDKSNTFYDYDSKYISHTNLIIPAKINNDIIDKIKEYSNTLFKILSLKDYSRIDFLLDEENNQIYFNEVNTIPGFTDISMFPKLFKYQNISIKDLITILLKEKN